MFDVERWTFNVHSVSPAILLSSMSDQLPESLPSSPEDEMRRQAEFEKTLDDALDETPRAEELRHMRDILRRRQSALQQEFDSSDDPVEREHLQRRLNELDEQITCLLYTSDAADE